MANNDSRCFILEKFKKENNWYIYFLIRSEKSIHLPLGLTEAEALKAYRAITNQGLVVSQVSLPMETLE